MEKLVKQLPVPGYRTTEFWMTIALNLSALLGTIAGVLPPKWAGIMATAATILYTIARGWVKAA